MFPFELSIKELVNSNLLIHFFAQQLGVEVSSIINFTEYFALTTDRPHFLALEVNNCGTGYHTFVRGFWKVEFAPSEAILLASKISLNFHTDVAIGDPTQDTPESFVVLSPDGLISRAVSTVNSVIFDVRRYGASIRVADFVEEVHE